MINGRKSLRGKHEEILGLENGIECYQKVKNDIEVAMKRLIMLSSCYRKVKECHQSCYQKAKSSIEVVTERLTNGINQKAKNLKFSYY